MKFQRNNMERKLKEANVERDEFKEKLDNLKLKYEDLLKDHHQTCFDRNKLELLCERKGWDKSRIQEFNKMKEVYKRCQCGSKDI